MNLRKTSEELLRECDVLLDEVRVITDALWEGLGTRPHFDETASERLLRECSLLIDECHLMNDAIEGWLGTKPSLREEVFGTDTQG